MTKKGELKLDFGDLNDPQETPKERLAFCNKVATSKPVILEIVKRMRRLIGREYMGKIGSLEDLACLNGMWRFADELEGMVNMFEGEYQQRIEEEKPVPEDKLNPVSSGSELEL